MRPLVIAPETLGQIKRVVAFATENPVSLPRLQRMATGLERPIGDDPRFALIVPVGFRCAFSFEEQPVLGLARHLSVSVQGPPGRLPSPEAMALLMEAFGFSATFCKVVETGDPVGQAGPRGLWVEEGRAINVVEKA